MMCIINGDCHFGKDAQNDFNFLIRLIFIFLKKIPNKKSLISFAQLFRSLPEDLNLFGRLNLNLFWQRPKELGKRNYALFIRNFLTT